jgi:hypothetical protein
MKHEACRLSLLDQHWQAMLVWLCLVQCWAVLCWNDCVQLQQTNSNSRGHVWTSQLLCAAKFARVRLADMSARLEELLLPSTLCSSNTNSV